MRAEQGGYRVAVQLDNVLIGLPTSSPRVIPATVSKNARSAVDKVSADQIAAEKENRLVSVD